MTPPANFHSISPPKTAEGSAPRRTLGLEIQGKFAPCSQVSSTHFKKSRTMGQIPCSRLPDTGREHIPTFIGTRIISKCEAQFSHSLSRSFQNVQSTDKRSNSCMIKNSASITVKHDSSPPSHQHARGASIYVMLGCDTGRMTFSMTAKHGSSLPSHQYARGASMTTPLFPPICQRSKHGCHAWL
eukprot:1139353-Pelagomonas_calceolata.AAC.1